MNVEIAPAIESPLAPMECRITLNPELDKLVFVAGQLSVGFDFEDGLRMEMQLRDALVVMAEARKQKAGPVQ